MLQNALESGFTLIQSEAGTNCQAAREHPFFRFYVIDSISKLITTSYALAVEVCKEKSLYMLVNKAYIGYQYSV